MSFTAIVPQDFAKILQKAADQAFMTAINGYLDAINEDFLLTMVSWTKQAEFTIDNAHYEGGDLIGSVWTDNEIYGYVNNGTVAHDIYPVKAKRLRFMSGFQPKTYVRILGAGPGGSSPPEVFRSAVHHPGSEGRAFDEAIVTKRQPDFPDYVLSYLQNAIGG